MNIINKKASYNAYIQDTFEAGIVLLGAEVKAVKQGHADLSGSFVKIVGNEIYLINTKIFPYEYARPESYDPKRTRNYNKKEIISLK
jgi:SsrA-binding protein